MWTRAKYMKWWGQPIQYWQHYPTYGIDLIQKKSGSIVITMHRSFKSRGAWRSTHESDMSTWSIQLGLRSAFRIWAIFSITVFRYSRNFVDSGLKESFIVQLEPLLPHLTCDEFPLLFYVFQYLFAFFIFEEAAGGKLQIF